MSPNITNSTTVDERLVEMRIDNSKFEDGAKKTIGILEKLDKALHLHAETDEIDKLNNAIGKFDVSPMVSGLDSLQSHFSALEIMGMRVISNLTDSVYNFTTRTIKSLSIDQVTAGWSKYEDKTSAVQTIMAATRKDIGTLYVDEADQMAAVNEQMEKLNWFTDETSYSFLDMVNNIGKFTSNGRALDESVTAMMGISTWAAISGAKVQEAGRVMYNLSQALGTGSVQVRDWMSIENANMATYEFKQMAIETAEELGTLRKVSDGVWESLAGHEVTIESFRENLKDDWFTSDVLLDTLQNYGLFTEALKIATEETDTTATEFLRAMERYEAGEDIDEDLVPWIEELSKAEYDLGRRAFQAAQEAKTFTEAIDATKDAVSTGWMNTFEIILGDYKTAKGFWTDVANDLWDIFAGGGETRNSLLEVAFGDTVDLINRGELFRNSLLRLLELVIAIKDTISAASENIFGTAEERGEKLGQLIENFYLFLHQITFSEEAIDGVRNVFEGFFTVIKIGGRVVGIATKLFGNLFVVAIKLLDKVFGLFGRFSTGNLVSIIDTVLESLSNGVDLIFGIIHSLLDGEGFSGVLESLGDGFTILLAPLLGLFEIGESIVNFFSGLFSKISEMVDFDAVLSSIANTLQVFGLAIAGLIGTPLYGLFTVITNFFTAIKNGASSLYNMAKNSEVVQGIISSLTTRFSKFSKTIELLKNNFNWGYLAGGFLGGLEAFWDGIKSEFSTTFPTLYNVLANFFGIFASGWHLVSSAFDDIKNFFSGENLQGLFDSTLGFFASLPQFLGNGLKGIGALFAVIFGGITRVITGVINSLEGAKINTDKIEESFNEFYEIVKLVFNGIFGDPTELKERITNFVLNVWEGFKEAIGQISLWDAIKAFRIASLLALLAKISSVIGNIKRVTYEVSSIPEAITNVIGKGSLVFDDIGKSFRANAMIKLAISLGLVAMALYGLSRINEQKLTHAAAIASLVMIVLTMIVNSLNKNQRFREVNIHHNLQVFDTVGSALIGLGIAVAAITFAIVKLEQIAGNPNFIGAAITVGIILAILAGIVGLFLNAFLKTKMHSEGLKVVGKTISKLGGTMLLMSIAVNNLVLPILALTAAAAYLENKGLDNARWIIWGSAIAIAGLIFVLGLAVNGVIKSLTGFSEAQLKYVGGAMLKIAASMYVFAMALGRFMRPFFLLAIVSALIYDGTDKSLEPIWTALEVITGLLFMLGAFLAGMTFLLSRDSLSDTKVKEIGNAMLKMGASIALLGIGMKKLIFAMLEIVVAASILRSKGMSVEFEEAMYLMKDIFFAVMILVSAMTLLSALPHINLTNLLGIAAIITALGIAFLFITPAIIVLAIAIGVLVGALAKLTDTEADKTLQHIKDMTSALVWIAVAAAAFGGAILMIGAGAIKFALAIGILALSVLALGGAFALIGVHQDAIIKFFKRFFNFFKLSKSKAKSFGAIALGIVAFTVAVGSLVGVLKLITKGFKALRIISNTESFGKRFSKSLGSLRTTLLGGLKNTFTSVQTFLTDPKNIGIITQALGVIITTVGLYLAGVIPTFTETVVTSFITLVQSLSASIQAHRKEFSTAISDAINTLFAIVGDVFKEVFLNPESWAEGGIGGGIVRVLFGLFLAAKVLQAITAIGKFIGGLFGLSFGKKAGAGLLD